MYCKTQQNILIWGDRVTPYWLQETTSDDQERILFLFSVEIKNKERNKKFRATKQSWHSGKQASFAFTRILFIPKSKCLSPFLKCKKDQLHPTLLTTFIPPFTLFLHPRPLLHLPVCSSWMSFFFWDCSINLEGSWIPESHPLPKSSPFLFSLSVPWLFCAMRMLHKNYIVL